MATIIKIPINERDRYPKLILLYKRYNDITAEHCIGLIKDLYKGIKDVWINPLTKRPIKTTSDRFISFLSTCYYIWGDNRLEIDTPNWKIDLTYKEHITKFIPVKYLFEIPLFKKYPNLSPLGMSSTPTTPPLIVKSSSSSSSSGKIQPPPPVMRRSPSINSPQGAATNAPRRRPRSSSRTSIKSISPPRIRNAPRRSAYSTSSSSSSSTSGKRQPPPPVMPRSPRSNSPKRSKSPITKKLTFSMISSDKIIAETMFNANQLKESDCNKLLKEMKKKMRNKTDIEILNIRLTDPITTEEIGIDSPFIKSYLAKCYYGFDNKNIKKNIDKLVNIGDLDNFKNFADKKAREEEEELLKREKEKEEFVKRRPDIEKFIAGRINTFNELCDELIHQCKNGILPDHKYISSLVEIIMKIIYTKYLHLNMLYDDFDVNILKTPLYIYMYDDEFDKYYTSNKLNTNEKFRETYDSNIIKYQNVHLKQELGNKLINMVPKTIDRYYENTLYNRQYVFELVNFEDDKGNFNNPTMRFNKINNIDEYAKSFKHEEYPATKLFAYHVDTNDQFNYDITNGVLPKHIFISSSSTITEYFTDIIELINAKLQGLPIIKGFKDEVIDDEYKKYYEGILKDMEGKSFGNNETAYGEDDMIRKNLLFSLNAQTPSYILKNRKKAAKEIYYNTKFSGTFPLFTWIPLNHTLQDTIYNFPNFNRWQPLELYQSSINGFENAYKNDGNYPYSKWLNETIYKVITDKYASVNSLEIPLRINAMRMRIIKTIGAYKDDEKNPTYDNNKIYLYHGTKNRLHNINGREQDIELLGFLSTSINMYTASYYSGVGDTNNGLIYIIEVDKTQAYINLLDNLYQIVLLPNSIIKVIHEFNFGAIRVVLCRLIKTPSVIQNNLLYNKLLDIEQPNRSFDKHISYNIEINTMPTCAYILRKFWNIQVVNVNEYLKIYKTQRENLHNILLNKRKSASELKEDFIYFSLGQEYDLYVERGMPLMLGNFADIKYSIHQHFIKDCYKALEIPCIDYIFIHSPYVNNAIATGILLSDYKQNRINQYKYDVNNFFIDCIFKFNSFNNENKKLTLPNAQDVDISEDAIYADKIEGFRDAGLYLNGEHNPLFNSDAGIGEYVQYLRNWKQLFTKYDEASDEKLEKHFMWCNDRIVKLIEIIYATKDYYLKFIENALKHKIDTSGDDKVRKEDVIVVVNKEMSQLNDMIEGLTNTLLKRAEFYKKCTNNAGGSQSIKQFIEVIRVILKEAHVNTHNSKLYKAPLLTDLMVKEGGTGGEALKGGILSQKQIKKKLKTRKIPDSKPIEHLEIYEAFKNVPIQEPKDIRKIPDSKPIEHLEIYEAFKNVPIQESKDIRKYADMPKSFKKYYRGSSRGSSGSSKGKDKYIDISNHCYFRFV